jgi:membrane complex biogenesis BtpA family protein
MTNFLKGSKAIIAMVHVGALPGTPRYAGSLKAVVERAREEALRYRDAGVDMLAIENMHDVPYCRGAVGPEITAAMAVIGHEVKQATGLRCGIQILAGANREAMGAAVAAGLDFVRAEGYVFAHVADEGILEGCAADLLRYRRQLGADDVLVITDIKKKHSSHALTADVDIVETAHAAEFFASDGVIVTGTATGHAADLDEVRSVAAVVKLPVLVGSGVTLENVQDYLQCADALIVGSYLKEGGSWEGAVSLERTKAFMAKVREGRGR